MANTDTTSDKLHTAGNELAKAFVAFQKELKTVKKDGKADAGKYGYTYATLDAIIEAVREPLANNGLSFTQPLSSADDGKINIATIIRHESGDTQESHLSVNVGGLTPQQVGSVFTYYKRYSLGAALGIATEEDDGKVGNIAPPASTNTSSSPQPAKSVVSAKQLAFIQANFADLGIEDRDAKLMYVIAIIEHDIESSKELTLAEAKKVIDQQLADKDDKASA